MFWLSAILNLALLTFRTFASGPCFSHSCLVLSKICHKNINFVVNITACSIHVCAFPLNYDFYVFFIMCSSFYISKLSIEKFCQDE